jgi:cytochrome P450
MSPTTDTMSEFRAERLFTESANFTDMERWHDAAAGLRRSGPVHHFSDRRYGDFWAVVQHEALLAVSRQPDVFPNTRDAAFIGGRGGGYTEMQQDLPFEVKTLLSMDGEEHTTYRKVVVDWFKPSAIRRLQVAVDDLVAESVRHVRECDGELDFAMDIAVPLPLRVIMEMLGVPRADEPLMLTLTQEMFSAADPELGSGNAFEAMGEMVSYFLELVADRRAHPTEDLTSAIANATIGGEPVEMVPLMGLFAVLASAGHDTTSFAMSGGVEQLARRPDELRRLRSDPSLAENAAHEVVRLTSPVRHFTRLTVRDTEVAGHRFRAGDRVLLSYPSANRDHTVFPDPDRLDVGRPNASHQVGWGHGPHYCLGARLAQMEITSLLVGLAHAVESIEPTGDAEWTAGHFVSGVKHLPVRCRLA